MMRRWLRPLWIVLALVFLLEAWLWERLQPVVARIVSWFPLDAMKARLAREVAHLGPRDSFYVLSVPAILYTLVEVYSLVPLMEGRWIYALTILTIAKIIGAAVTSFVFDVVRDKVLQLNWFRRVYEKVIGWRAKAFRLAGPFITMAQKMAKAMRRNAADSDFVTYVSRMIKRLRAHVRRMRAG
jgi:hypothetical protein